MIAYYEIRMAGERRVMKVDGVKSREHADKLLERIKAAHAHRAKLINLEGYALHYTANMNPAFRTVLQEWLLRLPMSVPQETTGSK